MTYLQEPEIEKLEERLYQPKEVSEITNIDKESLRKYTEFFNVQTQWTQPNNKGHRRYTKENIAELISIREKVKDQNWSWAKTLSWRNGETDVFITSHEEKSNLEKKMDQLLEEQIKLNEDRQMQEQFNLALVQRIDELFAQNHQLRSYIEEKLNPRITLETKDRELLESIRQGQMEKQKRKKIFGIF